ncbi:hypothetical protein FBU59_000101 [Linderina macrospora]|uniref:Uncharacterized protein n=1 Tax=Linderina macrospora TaxID=4868 RepID=A0ACC1JHR5_9FUNG|nr:hypothetical protein FBU59_000101 [Linderina macrospora]
MFLCGVLWFIGDIPANGHVHAVGVWSYCKLWHLWIRLVFGYLFSCCVLIRAYALHRVFVKHCRFRGWSMAVPILLAVAVLVIYCLAGQLNKDTATIKYIAELEMCKYTLVFHVCSLVLLWAIWLLIALFMFLIRNIQSSFNERRESMMTFIITMVSLLQTTFVSLLHSNSMLTYSVRLSSTWIDFINGNLTIWIIIIYPVYQSLFHRTAYQRQWLAKLENDGLKREYDVHSGGQSGEVMGSTKYSLMGDSPAPGGEASLGRHSRYMSHLGNATVAPTVSDMRSIDAINGYGGYDPGTFMMQEMDTPRQPVPAAIGHSIAPSDRYVL